MRINHLRYIPVPDSDADDQLSLPFADYLPPPPRPPVTHRQVVEFGGRRKRSFELVVHLDPTSLVILAYRLRPITKH